MQIKTSLWCLTASLFLSAAAFGQAPDGDSAGPYDRGAFRGDRAERGFNDQDRDRKSGPRKRIRERLQDARDQRGEGRPHMRGQRQEFERPDGRRGQRSNERLQETRGGRRGFGDQRGSRQSFDRAGRGAERFGPKAGADQGRSLQAKLDALKAERRELKERISQLKERQGDAKPDKPRKEGRRRGRDGQGHGKKHKTGEVGN